MTDVSCWTRVTAQAESSLPFGCDHHKVPYTGVVVAECIRSCSDYWWDHCIYYHFYIYILFLSLQHHVADHSHYVHFKLIIDQLMFDLPSIKYTKHDKTTPLFRLVSPTGSQLLQSLIHTDLENYTRLVGLDSFTILFKFISNLKVQAQFQVFFTLLRTTFTSASRIIHTTFTWS